ncbi:hypothetical protein CLAIMM_03656 [Cladophialophora immunda]|nr:hypothetical protein CLAIMM_03656 [Cladophialophora immunda]
MNGLRCLRVLMAGGATGIGATTARLLAEQGAKVVIGDININGAQALADQIRSAGGTAHTAEFDFAEESSVKQLVDGAADTLGGLDCLINMGADLRPEVLGRDRGVDSMEVGVWRRTLEVNLIGSALSTRYAIPHFLKGGKGNIVYISSAAVFSGQPLYPAYSASKAGVEVLTRHVANTWGPQKIRANTVSFGMIATEPGKRAAANEPTIQELISGLPLQRMGEPREPASLIMYLLSEDAAFVTGQVWQVNGGQLLRA